MAKRASRSAGFPAADMFWQFVESDPKRAVALAFQLGAMLGQAVNRSDAINTSGIKRKFSQASGALADVIPNLPTILNMMPLSLITGEKPGPKTGARSPKRAKRRTVRRKR